MQTATAAPVGPAVGVYMGDSIASGYPMVGRLNPRAGAFFPTYSDQPGQPAYEMTELTGYEWFNNAIAGQTTVQIAARWCRDVLDAGCDPGDGLGRDTLPRKPGTVVLSAGLNDLYKGVDFATTKKNLTYMVRSAAENRIHIVVYTTFMFNLPKGELRDRVAALNRWIISEVPKMGGHVYRYDQYAVDHAKYRSYYYVDTIHPNKAANRQIAAQIYGAFPFLRQPG